MKNLSARNSKSRTKQTRKVAAPYEQKVEPGLLVYSTKEFGFGKEKVQTIMGVCVCGATSLDDKGNPIQKSGENPEYWLLDPVIASDLDGNFFALPDELVRHEDITGFVKYPDMFKVFVSVLENKELHKTKGEYFDILESSFDRYANEQTRKDSEEDID
jgi:hypothetical protein